MRPFFSRVFDKHSSNMIITYVYGRRKRDERKWRVEQEIKNEKSRGMCIDYTVSLRGCGQRASQPPIVIPFTRVKLLPGKYIYVYVLTREKSVRSRRNTSRMNARQREGERERDRAGNSTPDCRGDNALSDSRHTRQTFDPLPGNITQEHTQ